MIKKLLDERQNEIMEGVKGCLQINSVRGAAEENAPYGEGPKKALEYALKLGEELGFRTGNVDNRSGWVEYGDGEEMIAVLGHLDVVPLGEGWKYPGFDLTIDNGKIYGRGIVDDKGPTIGAIYALKAIKDSGVKLDRRIRVIFGSDEESGCSCIRHYVSSGQEIPVMGFTPDACYPLIFCEKGMTTMWVGKTEVSGGKIHVLEFKAGTAPNIVPQNCVLRVEGELKVIETEGVAAEFEDGITTVRAVGMSAHGSKPETGINAAIRLLNAVKENDFGGDFQNMMEFLLKEINTETNGEKLGIRFWDEETGETTLNVGLVNYSEEGIVITLDIRYPKNGIHDVVYKNVTDALEKHYLEVLKFTKENVLYKPLDSELVQKLMKVYREGTGREDQPIAIGGGTYAKMFPNMVAFGPAFLEEPDTCHQPDECIPVDKFMLAIKLTADAMVALATK